MERLSAGLGLVCVVLVTLACKANGSAEPDAAPAIASTTPATAQSATASAAPSTSAVPAPIVIDVKSAAAKPVASTSAPVADMIMRKTNESGDPQGSCPAGWVGMPGGACNRPCKTDADCHGKYKCKKLGTERFCDTHDWE